MKRFTILLSSLLVPFLTMAQEEMGLDQKIDKVFGDYTGWFVNAIFASVPVGEVSVPWVLFPLILGALYFTVMFKVPGIRLFGTAINTVRGKYEHVEEMDAALNIVDGDEPDTIRVEGADGEVNHFQALTAALSATVGLGNIAGVAVAVAIGGPGATFWMILAGLLGMSSKFVECTLGVRFREVDASGRVYGGPMYYLSKGLSTKNMAGLGKVLAVLFAIMCVGGSFGGGNMFQSNQAASIFLNSMGVESAYGGTVFGLIMAVLVGVVILGGIQRIASVTEKIVPFMAVIYVGAALMIIFMNFEHIPAAFGAIFSGAFTGAGIIGGGIGVLIQGFRRAAFSNEAGIGSAAIAHSAVRTKHPASEGVVALLEPFIDTVVICTMTALVIVIYNIEGAFQYGDAGGNAVIDGVGTLSGVDLTTHIFESAIPHFSIVLTIAVVLFAFSTMISWSYYGLQSWTYLFGKSQRNEIIYKVLFCLFVVVGAASNMGSVLNFSDAMIFAMMVPNMIGLFILAPYVREELGKYLSAIKNKG
ncbi:MAG: alanine:cation symporter family protein [Flavobacteriales bacterium]|nr:alanine:cation symporter family protein [Flavobacteriales bacterium]